MNRSDFAHHYRRKAHESLEAGDPGGALRHLERALRFSRTLRERHEILYDLAETAVQLEDLDSAEHYLNQIQNPSHPRYALLRGLLELQRFQVAEALRYLQQAVALDPQMTEAQIHLASALTLAGRPQEALALLHPLHRKDPQNPRILRELALAHAREGNLMQAYHLAQQATQWAPDDPHLHDFLAMLREVLVEGTEMAYEVLNPPAEYLRVFYLIERYFETHPEAPEEALDEAIDLWAQYSSYASPKVRQPAHWAAVIVALALETLGTPVPLASIVRTLGGHPSSALYRRLRDLRTWLHG